MKMPTSSTSESVELLQQLFAEDNRLLVSLDTRWQATPLNNAASALLNGKSPNFVDAFTLVNINTHELEQILHRGEGQFRTRSPNPANPSAIIEWKIVPPLMNDTEWQLLLLGNPIIQDHSGPATTNGDLLRYKLLFDNSPDPIVLIDPTSMRPVEFSRNAPEFLDCTPQQFATMSMVDYEQHDNVTEMYSALDDIKRLGHGQFETRFLTLRGRVKDVIVHMRVMGNPDAPLLHCVFTDISSRKQAERALAQSEENFRSAFYSAGHGVALIDLDGHITRANLAMCSFLRLTIQQLIRRSWTELVMDEFRPLLKDRLCQIEAFSIPFSNDEARFLAQGQPGPWGQISIAPVRDERRELRHFVCQIIDITDRKRHERTIMEQEARLKFALAAAQAGTLHIDLNHKLVQWDPRACEIHHRDADKAPSSIQEWLALIHPDDHLVVEQVLQDNGERGAREIEYRIFDAAGEIRYVRSQLRMQCNESNTPCSLTGLFFDVTDKKRAELELHEAKESAESANRAKSAFLASMSHELRTPLNAILGYTQIMQHQALDAEKREGVEVIDRAGKHLLTLINDILDLAKIESGRFELLPEEFSLASLLQDIEQLFHMRAYQQGIEFQLHIHPTLPTRILADALRLRQILINLLGNAVKFTTRGFVRLEVSYADDHLRLVVIDSGKGIPTDELEHIFNPFHQTGDSHSRAQGTGLGLSITRKLVTQMRGTIEVDSKPGKGSHFTLRIPLPASSVDEEELPKSHSKIVGYFALAPRPRFELLLADSNPHNTRVLGELLAATGFDSRVCSNTEDLPAALASASPDLALLDLDAFPPSESLPALAPSGDRAAVPVIGLSARAFAEDRREALKAGCHDFVTKPVMEEKLLAAIGRQLPLIWVEVMQTPAVTAVAKSGSASLPRTVHERLNELVRKGKLLSIRDYLTTQGAQKISPEQLHELTNLTNKFDIRGLRIYLENHPPA